jgi:hypothetical protein
VSRDPWGLGFTATKCHDGDANLFINSLVSEGEVITIVTVGIDLAKNVFAVHGVNERVWRSSHACLCTVPGKPMCSSTPG